MLWTRQAGRRGLGGSACIVAENTRQVGLEPLLWTAGTGEGGCHIAIGSDSEFCRGTCSPSDRPENILDLLGALSQSEFCADMGL